MYAHIPSFDILTELAQASSSQRDVMEKDSKKKAKERDIFPSVLYSPDTLAQPAINSRSFKLKLSQR